MLSVQAIAPLSRTLDRSPQARLTGGLLVSLAVHLAILLSLGQVPPLAATWMPEPFVLTVVLAPAPAPVKLPPEIKVPAPLRTEPSPIEPPAPLEAEIPMAFTEQAAASPDPATPERFVSLGLPLGLHYFSSKEVDVPAQAVNDVMLRYPLEAFRQTISGEVRLRMLINENGGVDDVSVVQSEPKEIFDEAAKDAAWQLQYTPAMKDGLPVKSAKTIAIVFDPTTTPLQ